MRDDDDGLWKTRRAAAYLDITQQTLRKWVHSGVIRAVRLSTGEIRIPRAELQRIQQPYKPET